MHKLIFLDTETTGFEKEDRIIEVAYKIGSDDPVLERFKPVLPIKIEASMVNHITNKMVDKLGIVKDSDSHKELEDAFNDGGIMVAHNAQFDVKMLNKEGLYPNDVICTMKVIRHLDTKDEIANYKMQYLRYYWELEINAHAHNAADDILVLEGVYDKLAKRVGVEEMLKITREPHLLRKLPFGKHKGVPFREIPRDYMIWLRKQDKIDGDLLYTLNYYINK